MAITRLETGAQVPAALSRIPAFPPVAIRALNLLSDEDTVEIKKLLDLLLVDPAFSAEILRAANSPVFGLGAPIDSVQHALVILGLERIKAVTLTVATRFYLKGVSNVEMLRRCWQYSVACALLAEELSRACGQFQDKAYTAALLHDVGRMGLLIGYSKQYGELLQEASHTLARGEPFDLLESERRLFGIDHCEAGRLLVLKWNLPVEFANIAGYHGDFPPDDQFDLLALVRIACALANSLGFRVVDSPWAPEFEEVLQRLPDHARHRFLPSAEELRETILSRLESFDIEGFGRKAEEDKREAPVEAVEAEPEEPGEPGPAEREEPEPAPAEMPARAQRRVTAQDIIVFVLGTVGFAALFLFLLAYLAPR